MVASFLFPLTPIGVFASSDKLCDDGTNNGEFFFQVNIQLYGYLSPVSYDTLPRTIVSTQLVNQGLQPDVQTGGDLHSLKNHKFLTVVRRLTTYNKM